MSSGMSKMSSLVFCDWRTSELTVVVRCSVAKSNDEAGTTYGPLGDQLACRIAQGPTHIGAKVSRLLPM
jgi:hypothetical protein